MCLFQEISVLAGNDQIVWREIRRQYDAAVDLGHQGRYVRETQLAGDRDAVITIFHEVHLADLINLDRWEFLPLLHCRTYPRPARFICAITR